MKRNEPAGRDIGMSGYLYRGKRWNSTPGGPSFGRIERVADSSFCEVGNCERLAVWRVGYGTNSVEFCARHTLATMRNRKIWEKT